MSELEVCRSVSICKNSLMKLMLLLPELKKISLIHFLFVCLQNFAYLRHMHTKTMINVIQTNGIN